MISGEEGARRQDVQTRSGEEGWGVQRVCKEKLVAVPMNSKSHETSEQWEGCGGRGRGELTGTLLPVRL